MPILPTFLADDKQDDHHGNVGKNSTGGLKGLTLYRLRRSFMSLTEWVEKHTAQPLELLQVRHERIKTADIGAGSDGV